MITAVLGQPAVQERQGGPWAYISPSRLNCWLTCPLKWRLRYVDGIRTPTTPSLFLGKCCHSLLEAYYRHRQLNLVWVPGDLPKRLMRAWEPMVVEEGMVFGSSGDEQRLQQQAVELVKAYLNAVPPDEPRPLAVETTMEAPLVDPATGEDFGIPLLGVVDLVLDEPDGPLIADFKTSARSAEPLEVFHELQLTSYAYLFRHCAKQHEGGLEIRTLIKTKVPKIVFHRYSARTHAHFARFFAVVREYLDALDAGRFNYRPSFGCTMCDFRDRCSKWAG